MMDLSSKSVRELVQIGNDNTLHGAGARSFWEELGEEAKPATLLREPASEDAIADMEKRLQVTLPDDYKDFLRCSNGLGNSNGGIHNGYFLSPEFHSTEAVRWIDDDHVQLPVDLLELPYEITDLTAKVHESGKLKVKSAVPLFDRALEIGTTDLDSLWLVHPDLVRWTTEAYEKLYDAANEEQKRRIDGEIEKLAGSRKGFESMDWCCVTLASGSAAQMVPYKSFGQYLERLVADSRERK